MNYLQLVNDFMVETGMEDELTTTVGQIDDAKKATVWIRDAWTEIQRSRRWSFRWAEGSFNTSSAQKAYTQTQQGMTPGDDLDCASLKITAEKKRLVEVPSATLEFFDNDGMPGHFGIQPNESMILHPIPDATYAISYAYWSAPVVLTADTDTPSISQEWHKAIVWKAIANYAREQGREWDGLYRSANAEYNLINSNMLLKFLPKYLGKRPL